MSLDIRITINGQDYDLGDRAATPAVPADAVQEIKDFVERHIVAGRPIREVVIRSLIGKLDRLTISPTSDETSEHTATPISG